jgi:uncharacterized protein YndB with AHSA1/START domain
VLGALLTAAPAWSSPILATELGLNIPLSSGGEKRWGGAPSAPDKGLRRMPSQDRTTVRLERHYQTPTRRVFEAWTEPAKVRSWLASSAPAGEVLRIELKPRVGAPFLFVVRSRGVESTYSGEYLEIERARRLVFTWVAAAVSKETTRVSVEMRPVVSVAGGTNVVVTHERVIPAEAVDVEAKWSSILDAIGALVET